jgi:DNA mismatch endonuclease (patch repair protein)
MPMADVFSPSKRSEVMRQVRSKDTTPEIVVRSFAHRLGYRFRLHRTDLPGSPDLVFPRLKRVVFVNGCFWHGHNCARGARIPKTNRDYWVTKIRRNCERDKASYRKLRKAGWKVLVIWECTVTKGDSWQRRLAQFLGP